MALHDDYLRRTPFELAFPDAGAARALVADIAREAEERGSDPGDPGAFVMLGTVGEFLRRLRGPDASAEAIHDYAALVFHAFHFLEAGSPVTLLGTHAARYLTGGGVGAAAPVLPSAAGYVQLPRNLFWVHPAPEAAAEAVDGLFWTASGGVLHVLLAVGLHEGRPGLGVVPLPEAPLADMEAWLTAPSRPEGEDFATTLPGGEMEGLHSLTTAGEALKLLARIFAYVARFPEALVEGPVPPEGAAPAPSSLPYRKAVLRA